MWCTSRASPRLDDQADLGALLLADQVVMHRRGQQQRRDRGVDVVAVAIAEHDDARPVGDRLADLGADRVERSLQRQSPAGDAVEAADHHGRQLRVRRPSSLMWMILASSSLSMTGNGSVSCRQLSGPGLQQVGLRPDRSADRGDDLFANRVERRVGHLGEQLLEVVEQQPRSLAEHGDRRVGAHRSDRLSAGLGHRGDDDLQLLVRVAEHLLAAQHALVAEHDVLALGQFVELDDAFFEPLARTAGPRPACA